jgi:transketolase
VVGLDRYGESGRAEELFDHFGFTPERVAAAVAAVLRRTQEA